MTPELDVLWNLRSFDEEQSILRQALARFPEQRADLDHRVSAEKAKLEALKGKLADLQKDRRGRERDIETATNEERKFQGQLPSVKKNEEYTALLHEIAAAKAKRSQIETEVLMLMDEEEKTQSGRPAIEQALSSAEREAAERRAQIERDEAEDQRKLDAIEAERKKLLEQLPAATRSRYERILASHAGRAVVPVSKGACGGCYRALPPQLQVEARRGERLLTCEGCGRIVIWPPEAV